METYRLMAINLNTKQQRDILVYVDDNNKSDMLSMYTDIDEHTTESENENFFVMFQEFRDKLLSYGYGLKCCGAMINAIQSPMAEGSEWIYLVTLGEQARKKDMVSIFDDADIIEFPDTKQQNEFFRQWSDSLRGCYYGTV